MTISNRLNRTTLLGNGISTLIPIEFPFHSVDDLVVIETSLDGYANNQSAHDALHRHGRSRRPRPLPDRGKRRHGIGARLYSEHYGVS
jgi:hypothetical protein